MTNCSHEWYELHANAYAASTIGIDMEPTRQRFLTHIPPGGRILDIGCGSGRDSVRFASQGFVVDARDRSTAMVAEAQRRTGLPVRVQDILSLADEHCFEGIWVCAVLLHLNELECSEALRRMTRALIPSGSIFLSVKKGGGTQIIEGRSFRAWNARELLTLVGLQHDLTVIDCWESTDATRAETVWINLIAQRC